MLAEIIVIVTFVLVTGTLYSIVKERIENGTTELLDRIVNTIAPEDDEFLEDLWEEEQWEESQKEDPSSWTDPLGDPDEDVVAWFARTSG